MSIAESTVEEAALGWFRSRLPADRAELGYALRVLSQCIATQPHLR